MKFSTFEGIQAILQMIQIFITKDGANHGPYTVKVVNEMLLSGELSMLDNAWMDGVDGWIPLDHETFMKIGVVSPLVSEPPSPLPPDPLPSDKRKTKSPVNEPSTGQLAKALADNLLKQGREAIDKVATNEKAKTLRKKASDFKDKLGKN